MQRTSLRYPGWPLRLRYQRPSKYQDPFHPRHHFGNRPSVREITCPGAYVLAPVALGSLAVMVSLTRGGAPRGVHPTHTGTETIDAKQATLKPLRVGRGPGVGCMESHAVPRLSGRAIHARTKGYGRVGNSTRAGGFSIRWAEGRHYDATLVAVGVGSPLPNELKNTLALKGRCPIQPYGHDLEKRNSTWRGGKGLRPFGFPELSTPHPGQGRSPESRAKGAAPSGWIFRGI